ncbi:MAG: prepilin-type N-terminal cleavage/methylation domain-containing protein [Gemmatimonadales bacterium]
MRTERGFSLVECVVASVLCAAGLLALAGATRATLSLAILGHRTAASADVAAARLALLRASACAAGSGDAASGVYREHWTVSGAGVSRSVVVEVSFSVSGVSHTRRYEAVLACPA